LISFTGRIFEDLRKYPKIVGGITQECTNKGVNFYTQVLDFDIREDLPKPNGVWAVESTESAEFVKLAETTYRDVNIALANQFAIHAESIGIDVYEVISGANSQKFSYIHQPGISVGGHCIPVYPQLYLYNDHEASIVKISRSVNANMPSRVVTQIEDKIGNLKGKNVLIIGLSFRPEVKEIAFSGALDIHRELDNRGALISVYDYLYSTEEIKYLGFEDFRIATREPEIIILHTLHSKMIDEVKALVVKCQYIYDGRNYLKNFENYSQNKTTLGIGK
jgi:nucleotide sugar dehydrogenase